MAWHVVEDGSMEYLDFDFGVHKNHPIVMESRLFPRRCKQGGEGGGAGEREAGGGSRRRPACP